MNFLRTLPNTPVVTLFLLLQTEKACVHTCLAALCLVFGNAFQAAPVLVWFFPYFFLHALSLLYDSDSNDSATGPGLWWQQRGIRLCGFALVQAIGFSLSILGVFNNPTFTFLGVLMVVGTSLVLWSVITFAVGLSHVVMIRRYPGASTLVLMTFPVTWTGFWTLVSMCPFGSGFVYPNSLIVDSASLSQVVSLFGAPLVVFLTSWMGTLLFMITSPRYQYVQIRVKVQLLKVSLVLVLAMIYGGLRCNWKDFFMKDIPSSRRPLSTATCITGLGGNDMFNVVDEQSMNGFLNRTREAILEKSDLVLWSEASISIRGNEMEAKLMSQLKALISSYGTAYVGFGYGKYFDSKESSGKKGYNQFALLGPDGSLIWKYAKSHLVPFVESETAPGPAEIAVADTTKFGRIGGAICMDFEFPYYLRQAGVQKVDLMLQPSWTWGPIGIWAFQSEYLRAIENGFGWVRCNSGGITAVVSPYGKIHEYHITAHDDFITFPLPKFSHVSTVYSSFGFLYGYLMIVYAVALWVLVAVPPRLWESVPGLSSVIRSWQSSPIVSTLVDTIDSPSFSGNTGDSGVLGGGGSAGASNSGGFLL